MIKTDQEFWKGLESSYRRLGFLALSMAAIAAAANFLPL